MRAWRRGHRLLAVGVMATQAALGGCQAAEPRAAAPTGLTPDFVSLASMAGCTPPVSLSRAQKPEPGWTFNRMLELGPDAPGSLENRTARIRAVVNSEAILEEEVVAAAFQQLVGARTEKDKFDILKQQLDNLIDREVILQDAAARLGARNNGKMLKSLQDWATKEFERQWLNRMMRANKYEDMEAFKRFLRDNGMPLDLPQRQWERNFMAQEYMRSMIDPQLKRIGHLQVEEYYREHADEFKVDDRVVWQDLFIAAEKHPTREAAHQLAETLLGRIRKGEDFVKLAGQYDNGVSALRKNAEGFGNKHGEISPPEAESAVWSLKKGEAALVEVANGYHIARVAERDYVGRRPFDEEKVQKEIEAKLKNQVFGVELKRIIHELKRKAVIVIAPGQ